MTEGRSGPKHRQQTKVFKNASALSQTCPDLNPGSAIQRVISSSVKTNKQKILGILS